MSSITLIDSCASAAVSYPIPIAVDISDQEQAPPLLNTAVSGPTYLLVCTRNTLSYWFRLPAHDRHAQVNSVSVFPSPGPWCARIAKSGNPVHSPGHHGRRQVLRSQGEPLLLMLSSLLAHNSPQFLAKCHGRPACKHLRAGPGGRGEPAAAGRLNICAMRAWR